MIMMSNVKPIQVIEMNLDGSFNVTDAHDGDPMYEPNGVEVTDPKDLPKKEVLTPDSDVNAPKRNWRDGMQGIVQPMRSTLADEVEALNPKSADRAMHERAAELEKITHNNAMYNPINLASQMYDLMSQYHKKIDY